MVGGRASSEANTFLENGCPVYFDNCLVGILIFLAIAHGELFRVGSRPGAVLSHNISFR